MPILPFLTAARPFVGPVGKYLIAPVVETINILVCSSSDNIEDMIDKVGQLEEELKKRIQELGQVKCPKANNWLERARKIIKEASEIEESYSQQNCLGLNCCLCPNGCLCVNCCLCLNGCLCVNCCSIYKWSKRSVKLKKKADEMLQKADEAFKKIENQPSTEQTLKWILRRIRDPSLGVIGVYGKGGVGKTTLAIEVDNYVTQNSCFEIVIMVNVSATPNVRSIPTTIGKGLGLDLSNDSVYDAREKLVDALSEKNFLLILDDVGVENHLTLEDVGIPGHQVHKRSKILLTSRSEEVCADMDAEFTMEVEPLSEEESWNLFVQIAGQHVTHDDRIRSSAESIVQNCKGLLLGIVTVARALSNRQQVREWAHAERDMKQLAMDLKGTDEEVLVPLKFSFDRLENDLLRRLFLYCACFPKDFNIGKLEILDFCVGEGLVDRLGSLKDARKEGEDLIFSLKNASMLEDGEVEGTVRMHDMMRQLAHWITSSESDSKFLISTGKSFEEAPDAKQWVDATRISLMHTQIMELPELREKCQKLTTLLLSHSSISTIPKKKFLSSLVNLLVLDLSHTITLKELPNSLSHLVKLRVLRLRECPFLKNLPEMGNLRHLQVLDLRNCIFSNQQILGSNFLRGVRNLRYLDVSSSNVSIPAGVVFRVLRSMEVLNLHEAYNIKWSVNSENESGSDNNEGNNFINVGELFKLTHLTSLGISFESINISDWFIPLAQKITDLELNCCTVVESAIRALNGSQNLQQLQFASCQGLKWVPTCVEGKLEIEKCEDLEKVLDGGEVEPNQDSFQRLNVLCLRWLEKLEMICVGPPPPNCFGNLRKITIMHCHRLKMVFTKGMPCLFNNLESIMVNYCNGMEAIIEGEEMNGSKSNISGVSPFPNFSELPALTHVWSNRTLHCPLLKNMTAHKCPGLRKDPLHIRNTDGLLVIKNEETGKWAGEVREQEIQEI